MSAHLVDDIPTLANLQTSEPSGPLDIHYYLTEGLEGVENQQYRSPRSFMKAIESQSRELHSDNAGQYMVFAPVTQAQLATIDGIRGRRYKALRILYLNDAETLIVKFTGLPIHQIASGEFEYRVYLKATEMGLERNIARMGSTTCQGNGSQKEADVSWKPYLFRPRAVDWPNLVIECGLHDSLTRLKADSRWWLENTGGQVNIVLLISISKVDKSIHFEQWELSNLPNGGHVTRANPHPNRRMPIMTNQFDIIRGVATGATLTLDFQKVFLRPPSNEGEVDITFTQEDLECYANHVWNSCR